MGEEKDWVAFATAIRVACKNLKKTPAELGFSLGKELSEKVFYGKPDGPVLSALKEMNISDIPQTKDAEA